MHSKDATTTNNDTIAVHARDSSQVLWEVPQCGVHSTLDHDTHLGVRLDHFRAEFDAPNAVRDDTAEVATAEDEDERGVAPCEDEIDAGIEEGAVPGDTDIQAADALALDTGPFGEPVVASAMMGHVVACADTADKDENAEGSVEDTVDAYVEGVREVGREDDEAGDSVIFARAADHSRTQPLDGWAAVLDGNPVGWAEVEMPCYVVKVVMEHAMADEVGRSI